MKFFYVFLILCLPSVAMAVPGDNNTSGTTPFSYSPLEFIPNLGQWQGGFKYTLTTAGGNVLLYNKGFEYILEDADNIRKINLVHHGATKEEQILKFHSYKVTFEGATTQDIKGSKPEEFYCNYFIGNDTTRWKSKIHPFLSLDYEQLYPGINMHLSSVRGNMKYEFVVAAGTDVAQIRMRYEGQSSVNVKKGNLVISTTVGDLTELKPYVFQYINDNKVQIKCNYKLTDQVLSFSFPDDYDHTQPLIIDPTVVFATFSGSLADNWGYTATYDEHGNFYNGGLVHLTYDALSKPTDSFSIVTTGAFQKNYGGGTSTSGNGYPSDIALVKYNSSGSTRLWATYLGGSDNEQPHSMIVDASDNLLLAGRTYSNDFPVTTGAYDRTYNGNGDIVVVKVQSDGSALLGSTYIGGAKADGVNMYAAEFSFGGLKHNYGDDARSEIQLDKSGNVYVTAATQSTDFPTTSTAIRTTTTDFQDGVVFKMNSTLTTLLWSTYIGGSGDDAGYALDFDTGQRCIYVAGATASNNFPTTTGTLHSTYQGNIDGFVLKFLTTPPYTLLKGTYIGTSDTDQVYGVRTDINNNVYLMGQSLGGHFPVTSGTYSNAHSSQFIMALDSNLKNVVFSTVYGTGDSTHTDISPVAFLVDTCQNIYISGWGGLLVSGVGFPSSTGSTTGLPVTSDAAQSTTDGHDFYFIILSRNAAALQYATFMGGTGPVGEHVDGGTSRFDKYGVCYQAICGGCGGSSSFPTTVGAWSTTNRSSNCNEIALKIAFELGNVVAKAKAFPNAKGCLPFTVSFGDSSINATTYAWTFGDGGTSTVRSPVHTFTSAGNFSVRLIINNPKACKTLDTTFLTITVDTTFEKPAFSVVAQDSCGPYIAAFTNTSVYSGTPGSSSFTTFKWLFGDGATFTGPNPPPHTYATGGAYTVTLIMTDTTACNSPDTITHAISLRGVLVKARFSGPDSVCKGAEALFSDSSSNGTNYSWSFGDGGTTSSSSPSHRFDSVGTFTIREIVGNPSSCNGNDTFYRTIKVNSLPVADFTYTPLTPKLNVPTSFVNQSINALTYSWDFGDANTSTETNPTHFYKRSGTYNVCLTAKNRSGCPSNFCRQIAADVQPRADVPTAFSPNGDGTNDILFIRGGAIQTVDLKIFNRWGQLMFETTDIAIGWDGKYKGAPQPMDAYAYVLQALFVDGTSLTKKGNITLLR
ncbi:MAG: PKD domain-containing protein [Taibaiella sp.]|nr:PKD domain-containing protein [Taibaiella sp.]